MIHAILEDPDKAKIHQELSMDRTCDHTPCGIPREDLDHHPSRRRGVQTYFVMWRDEDDEEVVDFAPKVTCPVCSMVAMELREHVMAIRALEMKEG